MNFENIHLSLHCGATPENVADAVGGRLIYRGTKNIFSAVIDSRSAKSGDLFVAIRGEKVDGHSYIDKAAAAGASAVLSEHEEIDLTALKANGCSLILVDSTSLALGRLAKAHKTECNAITVGVTGSVGKTTTRQFIASVLSSHFKTHKTDGNFNNELGLPLTLLSLDESHGASVLEMGMSAKGEIAYLTDIARPDIAVITNIGTAHIEYLGSREGIRDAKMEITQGLKPNGRLILCGDEPLLAGIDGAVYCSIKNKSSDFRAENIKTTPNGMKFDAVSSDRIISELFIPTFGEHTVLDALYAVCIGVILGLTDSEIRFGLTLFEGVGNRQKIVKQNEITYILDYYNASPESIKASLSVTRDIAKACGGRTVAVLGSVFELGDNSESLHREIGEFCAALPCDILITFGEEMCFAAKAAAERGMNKQNIFAFPDLENAVPVIEEVKCRVMKNDCVLFKSSNSARMDRVADAVISTAVDGN